MDDQLLALYHRHVGTAFDHQQRLAELLEKQDAGEWEYDPSQALLTFGKLKFEAPIVGTHALNNSWMWAWSNKHFRLTLTNRALGDTVRALVHRHNVHQLGAPAFALEPLLGPELTPSAAHIFGAILSVELGYDAFYTMPHDNGRELVLIRSEKLKAEPKRPLVRVAMAFPVCLQEMPVLDHKAALAAYAHDYNLTVAEGPQAFTITGDGKDELIATFDERERLVSLEGVALPVPKPIAPQKKPTAPTKPKQPKPGKVAPQKAPAVEPATKVAVEKKKPAAKVAAKPATKPAAEKKPAAKATTAKAIAAKPAAAPKVTAATSKKPASPKKPSVTTTTTTAAQKPKASVPKRTGRKPPTPTVSKKASARVGRK